jgi:transcriptional regulator with XRE-family HTH domain
MHRFTPQEYSRRLGLVIRQARLNHINPSMRTQAEFSEKVGINRVYLAGLETGRRMPGLQILAAISQTIGIPMSELFASAEELDGG